MSYEIDADFTVSYLFPPCVEDWLPEGHPARFIREFVDQLDLSALGFRTRKSSDGRPSYSAKLLLRVWLYCWFERIRSFRDIEHACHNHFALLWLTGQNYPDHNTLWRFWKDNQKALRRVFRQSARVALDLDMVQLVLHAVDGTKIPAASSRRTALHRSDLEKLLAKVDEQIDEMARQIAQQEPDRPSDYLLRSDLSEAQVLRERIAQSLTKLNACGVDRLQPNEPDVPMMKTPSGTQWALNAQAVVDEASALIVACDVVSDESDNGQLVRMIEQVDETLGTVAQCTVADGGYADAEQLVEAQDRGWDVAVNIPDPGDSDPYHISHFEYDHGRDEWICPQGKRLDFTGTRDLDGVTYRRYSCRECRNCPVKALCTKEPNRRLHAHEHYDVLQSHRAKVKEHEPSKALYRRKEIIEPRFGWLKQRLGFRRFSVRGLEKAKTQWACACMSWNLRRMWTLIWGQEGQRHSPSRLQTA
jgi:transposase